MTDRVLKTLETMAFYEAQFDAQFAVSEETGMFLHDQILEYKYKKILELGTWRGTSAIYMAAAVKALKEGLVTTVNIDAETGILVAAQENFQKAGVDDHIYLEVAVAEDYLLESIEQDRKFDLIFVDADKLSVNTYLDLSLQILNEGGVIYIDDVETMADRMPANFVADTLKRESLEAEVINIGNGLLQVKKR